MDAYKETKSNDYTLKWANVGWGKFAFKNVRTTLTQGDTKLGAQLLNYGTLVIDPKHKRMKF